MKKRDLYRLSGAASITAGVLFLLVGISFILTLLIGEKALIASGFLLVFGTLFELFGLIGFFTCQVDSLPRMGLTGFILMVSGIMINLFPPAGRVLFTVGLLLFALANQKTKTLPPWGFWTWLIGSTVVLASAFIGGNPLTGLGALINAGALIWLGTALRKQNQAALA
jgi:hypothetical protein